MKPVQAYPTPGITVTFDPNLCIHSAVCLKSLPAVFDTRRRPWIQVHAAAIEEVVAAIDKCPSGALQYKLADKAGAAEQKGNDLAAATIRLLQNGPLMVEGAFTLVDENGMMLAKRASATLCRCGATCNAPFCDGTHLKINFEPKKTG